MTVIISVRTFVRALVFNTVANLTLTVKVNTLGVRLIHQYDRYYSEYVTVGSYCNSGWLS